MRGEFLKFARNEVEERRILEKPWFLFAIYVDCLLIKCIKRCDMICTSFYVEKIQLQQIVVFDRFCQAKALAVSSALARFIIISMAFREACDALCLPFI